MRIEIPVSDVAEMNVYLPLRRRASLTWRIISHEGKELLKLQFNPEFVTYTVELEDYFKEEGINIRVNRNRPE